MTPKTNTGDADQQITNWFENLSVMLSLENHPGPNTFLTRRQVDASAIEPVDKWMQPCVDAPSCRHGCLRIRRRMPTEHFDDSMLLCSFHFF